MSNDTLLKMQVSSQKRHSKKVYTTFSPDQINERAALLLEMRHMEDVLIADYMEGKRQERIANKLLPKLPVTKKKNQGRPIGSKTKKKRAKVVDFEKLAFIVKTRPSYFLPSLPEPQKEFQRPSAEYSNKSPYGIASELLLQK